MEFFSGFDTYNRRARVIPALIAGLPILTLIFVLVPWDHLALSQVIAGGMGLVLLTAFADLARHKGKKLQARLGTGEMSVQWFRGDPDVPEHSKDRYRDFVANQVNLTPPSADDEMLRPQRAKDFYMSVNAWIREATRDHNAYPILFEENITYGFRRNMLGLKNLALICNALVFMLSVGILSLEPTYFIKLPNIDEKIYLVLAAVILHSTYLIVAVRLPAVREASRAYGRQLILSCETLIRNAKSNPTDQ